MSPSTDRVRLAEIYRAAAEHALNGVGYTYLSEIKPRRDYYSAFSDALGIADALSEGRLNDWTYDERAIALCLYAAMVEAGDA